MQKGQLRILGFGWIGGALVFVVLTGLGVWFLPFSVAVQMTVVFHALCGLALLLPLTLWQLRHWLAARKTPRRFRKMSAYAGFWLLSLSSLAGLIMTVEALLGPGISHLWMRIHLWGGVLALPFLAYHIYPRSPWCEEVQGDPLMASLQPDGGPARRIWRHAAGTATGLILVLGTACLVYRTPFAYRDYAPPTKEQRLLGRNPFIPSNASTASGRPIAPQILADSKSCGASGCHTAIYHEWLASAHHWSAEDQFFQAVRSAVVRVQGEGAGEKCAACHDPVSLLAGFKDPALGTGGPGYDEGDSCVVCHSLRSVDERGIGSYVFRQPKPYLFEESSGIIALMVNHFLIRAYPEQHDRDYNLGIVRKPESCAPCHKEFDVIDKRQGPVQVETQYDDWKRGKWNTNPDPMRRLYCQQCHMYEEEARSENAADPYDLQAGLGRRYHNHYFAAANQFMPVLLPSPDASGQVQRVHEWLQGKRLIPEIQTIWPKGPVVSLTIETPRTTRPGATMAFGVLLTNNKAGHSFPTGPLNIVRAWVEVRILDQTGRAVFHSGGLDALNHIEPGSCVLRPLAITETGNQIMMADLWHPRGPKFIPAILPGQTESCEYQFKTPPPAGDILTIRARLRYRKANQFFLDSIYAGQRVEAPVTDVSQATRKIRMASGEQDGAGTAHSR